MERKIENDWVCLSDGGILGRVDEKTGKIKGVSLITEGKAKGHELMIDSETLKQLECAFNEVKNPGVKAKLNHRSGVEAVFGYISNVRVEGPKLLGDLNMLKAHRDYAQTMEQIQTMPSQIGFSVAFQGKGHPDASGQKVARCKDLISVDLVPEPAANPTGLFEAKVDKEVVYMESDEPVSNEDIMAVLAGLGDRIEGIEDFNDELAEGIEAELSDVDDEEEEYEDDDSEEEEEYDDGYGEEEAEYVTAGSNESYEAPEEYSAINDALTFLEAKAGAALEAEEEANVDGVFSGIEDKVESLVEYTTELEAHNDALQEALETAGQQMAPTGSSADIFLSNNSNGESNFEHIVQTLKHNGTSAKEAVELAVKESPHTHRQWMIDQGILAAN
jgi:hypothetical protein